MLPRNFFPRGVFTELNQLTRDLQQAYNTFSDIREAGRTFPAVNIGMTDKAMEIYTFLPGLKPEDIDVQVEKDVLVISGERKAAVIEDSTVHRAERFSGQFKRVISLPDDLDISTAQAQYKNGALQITIQRQAAVQPRRITVQ